MIKYVPVAQLYLSLISAFVPFTFFPAGDLVGYSILTNIVYYYFFKDIFIRDCVIGLLVMNIVSCFKDFFNYEEWSLIYDLSIFLIAHIRFLRYVRQDK